MAEIQPSGLQIRSLAQVRADLVTWITDPGVFGPDTDTSPDSAIGSILDNFAEEIAKVEKALQATWSSFDPEQAEDARLDALSAFTGTTRKSPTYSVAVGEATGTNGTIIDNTRQVRNDTQGTVWDVVEGPYTITGGVAAVKVQAQDPGSLGYSSSDTWSILLGTAGWDTFDVTDDIDPNERGTTEESDTALRIRRREGVYGQGNDLDAVVAAVLEVENVVSVSVFENKTLGIVDGVPGKGVELIVTGGLNDDIASAMHLHMPPGVETSGNQSGVAVSATGQSVSYAFSRPEALAMWCVVELDTVGAEGTFPSDGNERAYNAAVSALLQEEVIGRDANPLAIVGAVTDALRDTDTGALPVSAVNIYFSLDNGTYINAPVSYPPGSSIPAFGADPYAVEVKTVNVRQFADYDSSRLAVKTL